MLVMDRSKIDKMVRRKELPCVRRMNCCIDSELFVMQAQCRWKEKKVMEKQRRSSK
jgi:hypothetical protein